VSHNQAVDGVGFDCGRKIFFGAGRADEVVAYALAQPSRCVETDRVQTVELTGFELRA
jgi:hypothetical protein